MAGLRPPERDIGVARAPRWSGRALLALLGTVLLVLALFERLGLQLAAAKTVTLLVLVLFACTALLSPARRAGDYYVCDREVVPRRGGAAVAGTIAGLLGIGAAAGLFATGEELLVATAGLLLGCLVAGALFAPRLRRFGGLTTGDFLAARFDNQARLAGAAVATAASFLLLTAALGTAAPLLARFADLGEKQALWAVAAVTAAAVLPGGMRSLTASQVFQYTVAILACIAPFAFIALQNGPTVPDPADPGMEWLRAETPAGLGAIFALTVPALLAATQIAALPQLLIQAPSASSGRAAVATFGWAIVFSLILLVSALLFGQAALEAAGAPIDAMAGGLILLDGPPLDVLPPVLAGLAMAGLLAVLLALGQAALFAATSTLSHDVWDKTLDRRGPAGRGVLIARLIAALLAAAAAWVAGSGAAEPGVLLGWALALAAAGSFAPLLLGLWWRRCNASGALAGMLTGAGIVAGSFIIDPNGAVVANAGAVGMAGSFAAAILGSLVTAPPPQHQADLVARLRRGGARAGLAAAPRTAARPAAG